MRRGWPRRLALLAALIGLPGLAGAQALSADDVGQVISRVVQEATARQTPATMAVVDRVGAVLAVYSMTGAPAALPVASNAKGANATPLVDGLNGVSLPVTLQAIAKAVTAAYLSSSNGNAFSTRTASQIVQDHFNPGTKFTPSGPLYGVQFSQLPCSDLNVALAPGSDPSSVTRGPHRSPLGLAGDPGGFPLYKNGALVGGLGVKAVGPYGVATSFSGDDGAVDEILALAGSSGLDAPAPIRADHISAGGLLLRYSDATSASWRVNPASAPAFASLSGRLGGLVSVTGYYNAADGLRAGSAWGSLASGIMPDTSGAINAAVPPYILVDAAANPRYPVIGGRGAAALTVQETLALLRNTYAVMLQTRAQIRNPPGSVAAVTVFVVDTDGAVLGEASAADIPAFGIDVALQKARSAVFLSTASAGAQLAGAGFGRFTDAATAFFGGEALSAGYGWSARAIGTIHRDTYPDGADGTPNGPLSLSAALTTPFSDGLQEDLILGNLKSHLAAVTGNTLAADTKPFCTALPPASAGGKPVLANGLQIFPGGFPIYRGGVLIGGIGVSGDGVDQDDMIAFLGLYNAGRAMGSGFGEAPAALRPPKAHFVNCPFAPFVGSAAQNVCAGK